MGCLFGETDTLLLLEQWVRWSRTNSTDIGYPHMTPYRRLLGTTVSTPLISDDDAAQIDRAITALLGRDKQMGEVLIGYLMLGSNTSLTASKMGLHWGKVSMLVKAGTAWVDAWLYRHEDAA